MPMQRDHERLDRAMDQRRVELRMSWRDVSQAAGISEAALRTIRRGRHVPTSLTAAHIDDALRWPAGTVLAVLGGGEIPTGGEGLDAEDIRAALEAAMEIADPGEMRAALLELLARITPEEAG